MRDAKTKFDSIISRSQRLIHLSQILRSKYKRKKTEKASSDLEEGQLANEIIDELLRSSLVLVIAALDSYFTDKYVEVFCRRLKVNQVTTGMAKQLESAGLDVYSVLQLMRTKRPNRRIRTITEKHLEKQTTQRTDKIDELFCTLGITNLCANAEAKAKRKTLLSQVTKAIARRHMIVHNADLNSHYNLQAIDESKITTWLEAVRKLIEECDSIIENAK